MRVENAQAFLKIEVLKLQNDEANVKTAQLEKDKASLLKTLRESAIIQLRDDQTIAQLKFQLAQAEETKVQNVLFSQIQSPDLQNQIN